MGLQNLLLRLPLHATSLTKIQVLLLHPAICHNIQRLIISISRPVYDFDLSLFLWPTLCELTIRNRASKWNPPATIIQNIVDDVANSCPRLRKISIDSAVYTVDYSRFPLLESVSHVGGGVTNAVWRSLSRCPNLTELHVERCNVVTEPLQFVDQTPVVFPALLELRADKADINTFSTVTAVIAHTYMPKLRTLDASFGYFDFTPAQQAAFVAHFAQHSPHLERLSLDILDEGALDGFPVFQNLRVLEIWDKREDILLTDDHVKAIAMGVPKLQELRLPSSATGEVTPLSLKHLAEHCTALTDIKWISINSLDGGNREWEQWAPVIPFANLHTFKLALLEVDDGDVVSLAEWLARMCPDVQTCSVKVVSVEYEIGKLSAFMWLFRCLQSGWEEETANAAAVVGERNFSSLPFLHHVQMS
ncbi:hypothetical protein FRC04_010303 [Tulasnella sp. 424]|nr:hypothetical protein FRC04_010303 [Tulasnella sp. 424]